MIAWDGRFRVLMAKLAQYLPKCSGGLHWTDPTQSIQWTVRCTLCSHWVSVELHLENDHLVIASGNRPSRFSTSWWAWTEFSNFSHSEFLQPKQITSPAESPESPVILLQQISPTCQTASWSNGRTCLLLNLLIRLDSSSSRLFAFQTHEIQTNWLIRMSNRIRKSLKLCAILMPVMLTNAADWSVGLQLGSSRDSLNEFRCKSPDRAWSGC